MSGPAPLRGRKGDIPLLAHVAVEMNAPTPVSYDWESDFALRVAKAPPSVKARGFFLQAYLRQLRALGDEELLAQGLALCGSGPLIELFEYPIDLQLRLLGLLMPSLVARHGDSTAALRAVGSQDALRFLESTTGRLLLKLTGKDPKRLLTHTPLGYRMSSAPGEHIQEWSGPRSCYWVMKDQIMPLAFHEGILQQLLRWGGARNFRVVGRQTRLMDSEYEISWD